jgi:pyridoxal phosphate enzyme (YggS family)
MGMNLKDIRENYQRIKTRIDQAARMAGRNPENIHLVVVTKTHSIDVVQEVLDAGATDLGENYIEEAVPKIQRFDQTMGVHWHMIGHVQSRKALAVCEYFDYLHSLDSVKLAERLCRFAIDLNRSLPVFLEFNVSGEESKAGWNICREENWDNILVDIGIILNLPGITVLGLMTIPPYSTEPENSRPYYHKLKKFQDTLIDRFQITAGRELSMGMSGDFEVAIQEGATWVRIGQAILGPRSG